MRYANLSKEELALCVSALSSAGTVPEAQVQQRLVQAFTEELTSREAVEKEKAAREEAKKKAREDAPANVPVADVQSYWAVSNIDDVAPQRRNFMLFHLWEASWLIFEKGKEQAEVLEKMGYPEDWSKENLSKSAALPRPWAETLLQEWQKRMNEAAEEEGVIPRYTFMLEKPNDR